MDASRVFQNQKSRRREKRDKFVNEERDNEKLSKLMFQSLVEHLWTGFASRTSFWERCIGLRLDQWVSFPNWKKF